MNSGNRVELSCAWFIMKGALGISSACVVFGYSSYSMNLYGVSALADMVTGFRVNLFYLQSSST